MAKFSGKAHDAALKRLANRTPRVNSKPIEAANGGRGISGAAKKRVGVTTLKPAGRNTGGATGSAKKISKHNLK